jgi:hypothetical protein
LRRSPTPSQPSARRNAKTIWQTKAIATNDESALGAGNAVEDEANP